MRFARLRFAAMGVIASVVMVFAATAEAGTLYYWYGSDTTLGGAGTWNTTTTGTAWSANTGDAYSATYWPNTAAYDAYFGGDTGTYAVTVSGTVTTGALNLATSGYTFSTGTIDIAGGITTSYGASGVDTIASRVALRSGQTWSIGDGGLLTVSGIISNAYAVTKSGAGTLNLTSTSNSYSGGTTLSDGWLIIGSATSVKCLGTGALTVSGGTFSTNCTSLSPGYFATNAVSVTSGCNTCFAANYWGFTGAVTGSGTITINPPGPSSSFGFSGNNSNFQGAFVLQNGAFILRSANSGSSQATWVLNGGGLRSYFSGDGTVYLGALSGTNTSVYLGCSTVTVAGNTTFEIGALNTSTTFAGRIFEMAGTTTIAKVGTGTLTLTGGSSSYQGGTTLNAGGLVVDGSLTSAISVITGVLGGSGTISGAVTVGAATLAPGSSPATLTIAGALSLGSSGSLSFELNGADTTVGGGINDLIQSVTDLTLDGTLNVTETTAGSFLSAHAGDTWTLITYSGNLTDNGLDLGAMPALSDGKYFAVTATGGNVNLVVVPEPGVLALLATGLFGLIAYAWRKRR
jgi:fibronectin-binding autotransporter adhesin